VRFHHRRSRTGARLEQWGYGMSHTDRFGRAGRTMPRPTARTVALAAAAAALIGAFLMPAPASAAGGVACGDNAALAAAVASGGTVVLPAGCTFTLTAPSATTANGPDGLLVGPKISLTLDGQ